jgi:hypothetical protein
MADKRGRSFRQMEPRTAATRNGSRLTGRRQAWVTVSNINSGPSLPLANSADSAARRTAEPPGRRQSASLMLLSGERSTSPPMEIFSSVAGIPAAASGAFGRVTHRTRLLRRHLTRSQQSIWVAAWFLEALSIQADWRVKFSLRSTARAGRLTIMFTW